VGDIRKAGEAAAAASATADKRACAARSTTLCGQVHPAASSGGAERSAGLHPCTRSAHRPQVPTTAAGATPVTDVRPCPPARVGRPRTALTSPEVRGHVRLLRLQVARANEIVGLGKRSHPNLTDLSRDSAGEMTKPRLDARGDEARKLVVGGPRAGEEEIVQRSDNAKDAVNGAVSAHVSRAIWRASATGQAPKACSCART
jgi:hypothetical protein